MDHPTTAVTRRTLLAGIGAAGVAASVMSAPAAQADETPALPVTQELGYPGEEDAADKTSYSCDVLVVGSGWAGLHAAVRAARAGSSVICMDKGRPGYSGLTPFSNNTTWYDPDFDDLEGTVATCQMSGEYITNLDYLRTYIENTPAAWELNKELGLAEQYNTAVADGFTSQDDDYSYYAAYRDSDRHARWMPALLNEGVTVLEQTMATDLLTADGRVCGAVGFQFKTSTVVTVSAKAVVLCTGPSSVKSSGYPTSGNTFDGDYMAYQLGLPILGKEYDDFHQTSSWAPGASHYNNIWEYVQPLQPKASFNCPADPEGIRSYVASKGDYMVVKRVNQALAGLAPCDGTGSKSEHGTEPDPNDPKYADYSSNIQEMIPERKSDLYGAAAGMNAHMCAGVWCGWDDTDGCTAYPGLYVAGDGIYGAMFQGTVYTLSSCTSSGCSVQGDRAGTAAAAYAAGVDALELPQDQVEAATEHIFAPSQLKKGFDPNWARDQLQAIMVAPQIHLARSEATLGAALTQVEWMRDNIIPKLMGYTGHDLRLCLEMQHKILACELKLRAQLYRQESRGMHYRIDFPYRDDENFLCHVAVRKGDDGAPVVEKVEIPEAWKGDLTLPYTDRYVWRFPGEAEALGLPTEA